MRVNGHNQRAVVVVTEGASPKLLQRFIAEGLLPGFAKLFQQTAWGELAAHVVPYEPPGLMTAFTGTTSSEHGWISYWTVHEPDHKPRVRISHDLKVMPFWLRSKFADCHFSIVNVLGTHPPISMPGELITYPMGQTVRASYPADLLSNLLRCGFAYSHDVSIWYKGQARDEFSSRILEADRRRALLAQHFYENGSDVVIVNLTSIDRACHYYWQELEEESTVPAAEGTILNAFRVADELIRWFLNEMDDHTNLLVFSEIGFGHLKAYLSVNEILASAGFLAWSEPNRVDWTRTKAAEAVQGSSGININLQGRHPDGTVPAADYERVRSEVASVLRAAINPYTGLKLFSRVALREEIYQGDGIGNAPDLILFPLDPRYLPLGDPVWAHHVNRMLQSGWHRDTSYWALAGPRVSPGRRQERASLLQVLPTIEEVLERSGSGEYAPLHYAATAPV
jgi:predicted AlkP superfamily phosphohydrolase/phosphomutase